MNVNLSIKYNLRDADWDAFIVEEASDGGFLQFWSWGEFQKDLGRKIFRLAVIDDDKLCAVALLIKHEMPLGFSYMYCPRGPVIIANGNRQEIIGCLFKAVAKIAKQEQAIFFRLDPPWQDDKELVSLNFKFIGSVQPKSTLVLDLSLSEEELLAQMKPKTRYNIKVAQKHKIEIIVSDKGEEDFKEFWRLLKQTSERDAIKSHNDNYYRKMLKRPEIILVFAKFEKKNVAANIMIRFGAREIYLHGASDYEYRDKMGPYLLQWQMIQDAKKAGCRYYDFWGADIKRWPGVTRFKQGFAPALPLLEYIGAYDFVYNKFFYRLYNFVKKII
ncbi:MAG: peptidoglycan bridge formation glycyltransferase FemA/FemB family protein [Candidatus Buchananbacteria bacterium]|jgi:lipid II:glycine glycyltransferase (peptidoglycan interpeptide bridge formation enzyme)